MRHNDYPAGRYGPDARAARGAVTSYPAAFGPAVTRVLEAGHANPRTVLLLHGVGARADRWAGNLRPLAESGFRPIAFDLPGHGLATKGPHGHYTADEVVSDIREFLSALGVSRAAIVGTSLGGLIGAKLACQAPELCAGLMLIGSLGLEPLPADSRLAIARSLNDTSRDGTEAKLRRVIFDPAAVTQEWIDEEWRINNSPGAPEALAQWGRYVTDMTDADVAAPCLRQIGSPVMLVWGSNDVVVPAEVGQRAQQAIPAPMTVIEHTGHAPYLEDPAASTRPSSLSSKPWTGRPRSARPLRHQRGTGPALTRGSVVHLRALRTWRSYELVRSPCRASRRHVSPVLLRVLYDRAEDLEGGQLVGGVAGSAAGLADRVGARRGASPFGGLKTATCGDGWRGASAQASALRRQKPAARACSYGQLPPGFVWHAKRSSIWYPHSLPTITGSSPELITEIPHL